MSGRYVPPGARSSSGTSESRWAKPPSSSPQAPPAPTSASGSRWATPSPSTPRARGRGRGGAGTEGGTGGISSQGFRMARQEVGKKPGEMEMLLSPSRGLSHRVGEDNGTPGAEDENSLKNPSIQEKFRLHIQGKLDSLEAKFPAELDGSSTDPLSLRLKEELSVVLLDFRKLREGITSIGRVDSFAAEVYESSVRYSILCENWPQLQTCLPGLVLGIHPALRKSAPPLWEETVTGSPNSELRPSVDAKPLSESLAELSLTSNTNGTSTPAAPSSTSTTRELPPSHSMNLTLYLIFMLSHQSDFKSYHSTLESLSLHSGVSVPCHSHQPAFRYTPPPLLKTLYASLLNKTFLPLSRLLRSISSPSPFPSPSHPSSEIQLQLRIITPTLPTHRNHILAQLQKSYKVFNDIDWLSLVLLFPEGEAAREQCRKWLMANGIDVVVLG
ncbi:hypothetical protein T439DRAFT_349269 [Meredithblackwellia eburnea MCA 4105]